MSERPPHLFRASPPTSLPSVDAALRAGEDRERTRRRRGLAGSVALLVLVVAGLYGLKVWLAPGYLDHLRAERAGWKDVKFIAPGEEKVDPATGERTVPHDGFGVFADSEPEGARVSVAGKVLGETPLAAGIPCAAGETVTLRFEKAGLPARQVETRCRPDAMVKLKVALRR